MKSFARVAATLFAVAVAFPSLAAEKVAPDFTKQVAPIFTKYCTGCHNDQDREGKLSLASFAELQKGGENGVAILPGQAASSRLVRVLTGEAEPKMPPEGEPAPTAEEIEVLKAWIDSGAKGPQGAEPDRKTLMTPKLPAASGAQKRIISLAYSPDGKLLAIGQFGSIELRDVSSGATVRTLGDLPGKVNALHFTPDSKTLISASGVGGLYGSATLWNVADGKRLKDIEGHNDILYDAELSPDGKLLATCGYDRGITIWDAASGAKVRTLEGHNDAVYDLAFSPDGTVLASASGDKTVKLWKVNSGERLDTLGQPLGEQYVVTFSPDGKFVLAGGVDNRIRVWSFISKEKPRINPLVFARFAHEGAVVALAFSPDGKSLISAAEDRTVKRWETTSYTQVEVFEKQPEQVTEVAVSTNGNTCTVARLDGSLSHYPLQEIKVAEPTAVAATQPATTIAATGDMTESQEQEPNDTPNEASTVQAPVKVQGVIHVTRDQQSFDADLYRFTAKAGQEWMIEVNSSRSKSPMDSKIEVLDAAGQPIARMVLQAVRDSYFTFRGKDSDTSDDFRVFNWQEMEINEYLYSNGEVVKLWHYPRGPDSGFIVYPGRGRRRTFFDTTPISHALNEPCYIVEPHMPGTTLLPNGLPTFTLYYENDDDCWRQWGSDSRLLFTAPTDGEFIVRVTDARGFHGDSYKYELQIRPRKPDFKINISGQNPTVNAGGGREFALNVERLDAFNGEIRIDIEGLPEGFRASTPIVVQEEQSQVLGTINALPDAPTPSAEQAKASKIFASATINGEVVKKEIGSLGELKLGPKAKVVVRLAAANSSDESSVTAPWEKPLELVIAPGQTISAKVKIERNGFAERVPFGNFDSGRNLPHGVFVDNIGLNGLMIVEGQTEREFFITAAKWVPDQTRMFHLQAQVDGNQTSWPVILHVRSTPTVAKK